MELGIDLSREALASSLPGREIRFYPAILSTEADALAWARAGAPSGALVAAEYQVSPRGRAGLEWQVEPAKTLAFSLIERPRLPVEREGWLYTVATTALTDVLGNESRIEWPDEVRSGGVQTGAVGVHAELGPAGIAWAVMNVLIPEPREGRVPLTAKIITSIEERLAQTPADALHDYLERLVTTGRRVRARLIPLGPGGIEIVGTAVGALMDGALLVETDDGRRIAIRPQNLGILEDAGQASDASSD